MREYNSPRIKTLLLIIFLLLGIIVGTAPGSALQNSAPTYNEMLYPTYISGNTIYVDDDFNESTPGWGIDHFDKIQDGIDNANSDDTVFVFNGMYYENVVVNKKINLTGEDKNGTIIDGSNTGKVVSITTSNTYIDGFTIRNSGYYPKDSGIYIGSYDNTIVNNIFRDDAEGIYLWDSKFNTILENTIMDCDFGIYLFSSEYNSIKDNVITENKAGIYLEESSNNDIHGNIIEHNEDGIWIKLYNEFNSIVGNNIVYNSNRGVTLDRFSNTNYFHHNNFIENKIHASFTTSFLNIWDHNYWDNWVGIIIEGWQIFPKLILGRLIPPIPWLNFDFRPLSEPFPVQPSSTDTSYGF